MTPSSTNAPRPTRTPNPTSPPPPPPVPAAAVRPPAASAPEMAVPHPPVIQMQNVSLVFDEDAGVHNLSFAVTPGTIFGLIGPSGCGKTTTVRLLTGLYKPDEGASVVLGEDPLKFHTRT